MKLQPKIRGWNAGLCLAGLMSAWIGISQAAGAEPAPAVAGNNLSRANTNQSAPIVVTATRLAMPVSDVASAITVVERAQIEEHENRNVAEVLRAVPGLTIMQSGGPGGTVSPFMRGALPEQTLVLFDGVKLNDPINVGRGVDLSQIMLTGVDRIEVLRGPQSPLYGSDAIGGVINIIPGRAEGPASVTLEAEAGSFDTFAESAGVAGSERAVYYAAGVSQFDTAGISRADKVNGNSEADGDHTTTLYGRLGWTPRDEFALDANVRWIDGKYQYDDYDFATGLPVDATSWANQRNLLSRIQGRLSLMEGWDQRLGFSIADNHRDDHTILGASTFDSQWRKIDWQHDIVAGQYNTLTAGLEYQDERGRSRYESAGVIDEFAEQSQRTTSLFAQDCVKAGSAAAAAGMRVDDTYAFGSEATYRVAPQYTVSSTDTRFKGSYGTGFKTPSLFQLYSSYGNPNLSAEHSAGWDAGVEQGIAGKFATVGATWFHNDFRDLIDYDYLANRYENLGHARAYGVETFAEIHPFEVWTLRATYTRTETRDETTDLPLLRRPKNQAGLESTCAFTPQARGTLNVTYVGARRDLAGAGDITMPSYTTVNLRGEYDLTRWVTVFARVENLFDAKYEEVYGYGSPGIAAYGGLRMVF